MARLKNNGHEIAPRIVCIAPRAVLTVPCEGKSIEVTFRGGDQLSFHSNGWVLLKPALTPTWKRCLRFKPEQLEVFAKARVAFRTISGKAHWNLVSEAGVPSTDSLRAMIFGDVLATATDGCEGLEPDGHCSHGHKSWPLALGLI